MVFFAVTTVMTLALLESVLLAIRRVPALSFATPLRNVARELYMLDRNMIQFESDAARWAPHLGYTLRPGQFEFHNTEFNTSYRVNRLGVRDDESSLSRPRVVVIGDSFAMGWGVEQSESFPSVLEDLSGLTVLNTAIASYGTARQIRLLQSIDLSHATHLVIQFCNNDYFENHAFHVEGPDFETQTKVGYENAVKSYRQSQRYYPGRYSYALLKWTLSSGRDRTAPENTPDPANPAAQQHQVDLFLEVLLNSGVDLSGLQIIVFEINAYNEYRGLFTSALARGISEYPLPAHLGEMRIVDLASELRPHHFFRLDDHINAEGHRFLARRIFEVMTE